MIAVVWGIVFLLSILGAAAVSVAFQQEGWVLELVFSLIGAVINVAIMAAVFAFSVKYIAAPDKKEFKLVHGLKLFFTGHLVANILPVLMMVITVPLAFITARSAFLNTDFTQLGVQDYDQVMSLAGQGVAFGLVGILTTCVTLAGGIWGFIVEFIGAKKLTGASDAKSFIAVFLPYIVSLIVGVMVSVVMGIIAAVIIGSTSVG